MRSIGLIGLALLFGCTDPTYSGPGDFTRAEAKDLRIEGRVLQTDDGMVMGFPGTKIEFRPKGDEFSIYLETDTDGVALDVSRDGGPYRRKILSPEIHTMHFAALGTRAPRGGHRVSVIRATEGWQGLLTIKGIDGEGGFAEPPKAPEKKLLFIGDSITAGAGVEFRYDEAGEKQAVSNARLAYPRVLGDRLEAQVHQIAYGGRGLVRDWRGITDINNAPQFYDRVLPDDPDHLWDPAAYQPDIVSIMLGTNDFNPGIPDRATWTQAYRDFVSRVRTDYPKAQIFLISSPMTDGPKGDALKAYVKDVAESFKTSAVRYLEVAKYPGHAWNTTHPDAAEHQALADELEPHFRAALTAK